MQVSIVRQQPESTDIEDEDVLEGQTLLEEWVEDIRDSDESDTDNLR